MRWSSRSGSNWLDRLRSTKGFSAGGGNDLSNLQLSDTNTPIRDSDSAAPPIQIHQTQASTAGEWYGVLSNVLSELFNMGDQTNLPRFPGKRIPRKQTNPRICSLPIGVGEEGASAASLGSGNNSVEVKEESVDADPPPPPPQDEEEELDVDVDLVGYSRSEVTVIDTSFADWKFEKLVFRRKNAWKVRDKKGKPRSFVDRRKRKHGGGPEVGLHNNKRLKLSDSHSHSHLQHTLKPSTEEHDPQNKRREETRMERPNDLAQVLDTRISFSGSPRKLGMKGVPRSKRSGLKFPKTGTRLLQNTVRLNEMAEARLVRE